MYVATPRTDRQIQAAVEAELEWTPEVDAADIGVAVDDGVVSLWGEVDTFAERKATKNAALCVHDVTAVVNDVAVHPGSRFSVSEADIGEEVEHALRSSAVIPVTVKAVIEGGTVILTGQVQWDFHRRAAERTVQHLRGVESVSNRITLTPRVSAVDAGDRIKQAISRNAQLDSTAIGIVMAGDRVTLSGTVRSWAERRQADLTAWSSPHVSAVYNHLIVKP
jgi:osmotically-inducible protein OsmY